VKRSAPKDAGSYPDIDLRMPDADELAASRVSESRSSSEQRFAANGATRAQLQNSELGKFGATGSLPETLPSTSVDMVPGPYVNLLKPSLDRVVAALVLTVLAPLLALIAAAVRFRMGRGAIYRQQRVGRNGCVFTILKFRTMLPDRRREHFAFSGPDRRQCHKSYTDPRHTALGRVLRATSLDELPQLLNVVRGEMSLVGPRPELVEVVHREQLWSHPRHMLKPGITGIWQTSPLRAEGILSGLHLDLEYLQRISLREDVRILRRTMQVLLVPSGV
jgi:lipopolysaccharide/colanic/teichoic acid biosynthesis glycosyltransferase